MANVLKDEIQRRQRRGVNLPSEEDFRGFGYGPGRQQGYWRDRSNWQEDYSGESEDVPHWTYFEESWNVPGPYSGVGPRGYRRSDERIHDDIIARLTRHGRVDARDVQVEVNNGQVTITGNVDNRRTKRMIADTVESVAGVTDVNNQLRIQEPSEGRSRSAGFFW